VYALPNWDYRQAHYNGYVDCLKHIQFLINLDHKDNEQSIRTGQRPAQPPRRLQEEVAGEVS
jgi:predicted FMN-binding regulatory protein PaiB